MSPLACGATDGDYLIVPRLSDRRALVSSVAATMLAGLILWPAAASGGHSSSSVGASGLAGSFDPGFGGGEVTGSGITALASQPDGKIVAAGYGTSGMLLARYLPDGTLDPSFGDDGSVQTAVPDLSSVAAVALQPDGKIVVAGTAEPIETGEFVFLLARFNANGSLDGSFGTDGMTTTDVPVTAHPQESAGALADALALLPDGRILVGGWAFQDPNGQVAALVRYEPDGSLDTTFGDGGAAESEPAAFPYTGIEGLAVQSDGSVVASGFANGGEECPGTCNTPTHAIAVWRFEPDGAPDTMFHGGKPSFTNTKLRYNGGPMTLQAGKIVVAGYAHGAHPVIERLKSNGAQDTTFGTHGFAVIRSVTGMPTAVLAQRNHKLLAIAPYPGLGPSTSAIIRLLPNGRLDRSFGNGGIVQLGKADTNGEADTALALQADQKILFGGTSGDPRYVQTESVLGRLLGGNNCVVPGLRGKTVSKARAELKASYCRTGGISRLFSNRIARGHIISTTPHPADRRPAATKVDLLVSRGRRTHHS